MGQHIRIVNNSKEGTLSYTIMNAHSEWKPVSEYSALAESEYTNADINRDADKILRTINSDYSHGEPVSIILEGFDSVKGFCDTAETYENITVCSGEFTVLVLGKKNSGKSTLINAFAESNKSEMDKCCAEYEINGNKWYEIEGIDIEASFLKKTLERIHSIEENNVISVFIYCIDSRLGRIEKGEEQLILNIKDDYPEARIVIALTNSIEEENASAWARKISKQFSGMEVIPVLAKSEETRIGVIPAYGIDELTVAVYGG